MNVAIGKRVQLRNTYERGAIIGIEESSAHWVVLLDTGTLSLFRTESLEVLA